MSEESGTTESATGDWLIPHLHDLPAPAMPAAVSDRVLAALRTEAAGRQPSAPPDSTPAVADLDHARADRRSTGSGRAWWVAAAGVAAVALGALVYVETMPTAPPSGTVVAEAASDRAAATAGGQVVPISSGADYSAQNIDIMVPSTIAAARPAATAEALRATFAETEAGIRSCLAGVGNPPQDLALLDLAKFQDSPVAVLAYLDGNDDGTADVVVVGVRCSRDDPQVRHRDVADMAP